MWSTCGKRNASSGSFTSMSGASIGDSLSRLAYSLNTIHFHHFSQVISEVATSWTMAGHWSPTIVRWDSFSRYGSTSRTLWSLRFCDLPRHFRPFILPMISCITLSHYSHYSMVTNSHWLYHIDGKLPPVTTLCHTVIQWVYHTVGESWLVSKRPFSFCDHQQYSWLVAVYHEACHEASDLVLSNGRRDFTLNAQFFGQSKCAAEEFELNTDHHKPP